MISYVGKKIWEPTTYHILYTTVTEKDRKKILLYLVIRLLASSMFCFFFPFFFFRYNFLFFSSFFFSFFMVRGGGVYRMYLEHSSRHRKMYHAYGVPHNKKGKQLGIEEGGGGREGQGLYLKHNIPRRGIP